MVVRAALGERPEALELRAAPEYGPHDAGVRSLGGDGPMVERVPVVRFDDSAKEADLSRLDIVKLDVEGWEEAALRGMRESLGRLRPRTIIVELRSDARTTQTRGVSELLRRAGYIESAETLFSGNHVFTAG